MTYHVRHLDSKEEYTRPWVLTNPHSSTDYSWSTLETDLAVEAFHRTLPDYNETRLHSLESTARELGLANVFVKDESTRFGLPAFKILGASWAIHRAICQKLQLPISSDLQRVRLALVKSAQAGYDISLVTCSEGNWGRACARTGKILGINVLIHVPGFMSVYTQELLRSEGATVQVLENGSYDDAIVATRQHAQKVAASLMVMDTSWDGYEEIPKWVTDGYSTMLAETDRQVAAFITGTKPNTFFVSVGVGSWAHSVVAHYKAANPLNNIISVEPETSASLKESLHVGKITPIETGETICAGMNCGTTSGIAWPVLKAGITAAVTVTDSESHEGVEELKREGVNAGPCGAATLAALKRYVADMEPEQRKRMTVVLFSTEGWREYEVPA